jgi:hypothetical protein
MNAWSARYGQRLDALSWDQPVQRLVLAEYRQSLEESAGPPLDAVLLSRYQGDHFD